MNVSRGTSTVGWRILARVSLRHDAIWWAVWAMALSLEPVAIAMTYRTSYATAGARQALQLANEHNPSLALMYGTAHDVTTTGGFVTWRIHAFLTVLAGMVGALTVIRHTRGEEEDGRAELVRSTAVGAQANLRAMGAIVVTMAVVIALLTAAALTALALPIGGSVMTGASLGTALVMWGGIGAFAAQIFSSARSTRLFTMTALAGAYLLRGVADAAGAGSPARFLVWISPNGWIERTQPFVGDRWGVLVASILVATAFWIVAGCAQARRDVGEGLTHARKGHGHAAASLRSPWALVWRLERAYLLVWVIAMAAAGAMLGAIAPSIATMVGDTPGNADIIRRMGGQSAGHLDLAGAYFAAILPILALVAGLLGITILTSVAAAETSGLAAEVLSTATRRRRWLTAHMTVAMTGSALVLLTAASSAAAAAHLVGGAELPSLGEIAVGAVVIVPATWLVVAVALALWSVTARTWPAWSVYGCLVVIVWLGPALRVPRWVIALSPYDHAPHLPGGSLEVTQVVGMLAAALVVTAVALAAYERRDVA